MTTRIYPLSAFETNYIWIIEDERHIVAVDPGDAAPVLELLESRGRKLDAILITHHHEDHTGGVAELQQRARVPVYGPSTEAQNVVTEPLREGDSFQVADTGWRFDVLEVPGHTKGHIAYFSDTVTEDPGLFCGDTLFACGCGRLFEGTSLNMLQSIDKFKKMPDNTQVFCAHEYTLDNIDWALQVDPDNQDLQVWQTQAKLLREQNKPTIPTRISMELGLNPFMRTSDETIRQSAEKYAGQSLAEPQDVLHHLREWKNSF